MRKTLLIITLIVMFVLSGSSAMLIAFAEFAPIHPESKLFNFQNTIEHALLFLYPDSVSKSWYELKILEKRANDLESVKGLPEEVQRINAVWLEVDHVLRQFQSNSSEEDQNLRLRMVKILNKIDEELKLFTFFAKQYPADFSQYQERIIRLRNLVLDPANSLTKLFDLSQSQQTNSIKVSSLNPSQPILAKQIEPHKVPFLPGSAGAEHKFFLLTGKHAELTCEGCHSGLTYAGLPDQCIDCHLSVLPTKHYEGVCTLCHTTDGWVPANFNHTLLIAVDCVSCHLVNKPVNHYPGQCSACHSTKAWLPASFDHAVAGATDCVSCHANKKTANHFSGQCSACHSTNAWKPASFDHAAAGATDCQGCHSGNKPANHFAGQCSSCHSTSSWKGASFSHSFPMNHGKANGECAQCHPSGGSSWTCFNCHNEAKMTKKHEEKGIPDYVSRCMECHGDGKKDDD